ncbi:MAG TPA: hypothetical protein VIX80_07185 [Candidatus Kapabacteria bacterium]
MNIRILLALVVATVLYGCGGGTQIEQSWREPSYTVDSTKFNRFVVCALLKDESTRRVAEDQMVTRSGGKAIASYNYFNTQELKGNEDLFTKRMMADGADGMVMLTLAAKKQEQTYVPGSYPTYYNSWYGYYGYSAPMYYDPGYVRTDEIYMVEVNVYDLRLNKLVWSGMTSTINPSNVREMTDEIVDVVRYKMKEEKFITR